MTVAISLVWCIAIAGATIGITLLIVRRKYQEEFGAIFVLTVMITAVACALGGLYENRKEQAVILEKHLQQEAVDNQERLDRINEMPQPWISLYHFVLNEPDEVVRKFILDDFIKGEPPKITIEQFRLFTELDRGAMWDLNVWKLKPFVLFELPEVKQLSQLEPE